MEAGAIFGFLGFITGSIGAVTGCLAYRRTNQLKTLDLRLQLRRESNALEAIMAEIAPQMDIAHQSRVRVLAANGLGRSGAEKVFVDAWEQDRTAAQSLAGKLSELSLDYSALRAEDMERSLADLHRLSLEASRLLKKYQDSVKADDAQRAQIRSERTTMAAAQRSRPLKKKLGE